MSKVMASERISQVLPTVKCSDCGEDVHIHRLGDHICSNLPPVPALPKLPAQKDIYKPIPQTAYEPTRNDMYQARQEQQSPFGYRYGDRPQAQGESTSSPQTPNTPNFLNAPYDRPRQNSTSPAPTKSEESLSSPVSQYERLPRNDQARNFSDQQYRNKDFSKPATGGALDTLMADLINSMGQDMDDPNNRPVYNDECLVCGEEVDHMTEAIMHEDKVGNLPYSMLQPALT
ncbi:hypothetical protein DFQ30_007856 [Apophysomyces sp. BC1015]|nr:hypothetical protein DFQ30_007856 [Apophysomyces sp. BC1015]KAG0175904.1 hypothetical protein DFQ29_006816 [Apophysomyces sp. BC1021]